MIQAAPVETQRALPTRPRGETGREARLCPPALVILERFISISLPSTLACWVGHTQLAHRVLPPHPRWLQPLHVYREIQTLNLPIFNLPWSVVFSEFLAKTLLRMCSALCSSGCQWPSRDQCQSSTAGHSQLLQPSGLSHQDCRACPESLCAPTSCWGPCRGGRSRYLPRCSAGGVAGWGGTALRGSSGGLSGQGCAGARG